MRALQTHTRSRCTAITVEKRVPQPRDVDIINTTQSSIGQSQRESRLVLADRLELQLSEGGESIGRSIRLRAIKRGLVARAGLARARGRTARTALAH